MDGFDDICPRTVENNKRTLRKMSTRTSTTSIVSAAESSPPKPQRSNSKKPPLQRGSSFTFLTPGTPWDFTLKRKRKEKDDDTISLSSFDLKEPSNKRVRPLAKVSSLVNLMSPSKNGAVRRFGQTIQVPSKPGMGNSRPRGRSVCMISRNPSPTHD